ncbi:SNF2 helicase-associated domain-containing protein, partial [Endozoicomonas sp.]|uniref:SNF2 helicase-associated domain-containing protein n=1 Tax=Endozoicomonas sp. TaxID=1892382 RepID=UPI00383B7103
MATQYGKTWWGEQWLKALNGIDYSNRLPRGRRYAGNGSVKRIEVSGSSAEADVQGSRRTPYKVEVRLPGFSTTNQKKIVAAISQNPAVLARLLNRQLPEQTLALLSQQGISVFPGNWKDMNARCSCPDWAVPCKHIAAVIYLVANEIDKDPFLVFRLRGMDLPKAIEKASGLSLVHLDAMVQVLDGWQTEPVIQNWSMPETPAFEQFDLTAIEPLGERIFSILSPQPLFYGKDFRQVMAGVYKRAARLTGGVDKLVNTPTGNVVPHKSKDTSTDNADTGFDVTEFDRLSLVVDEAGRFVNVESGDGIDTPQNTHEWLSLLGKLHISQSAETCRHYHYALMWLQLYRLALKLVAEQAYVPGVYQDSGDFTLIRYKPALLSEPVKALLMPLYDLCPPDLVTLSHTPARKKKPVEWFADGQTQVDTALHLLISYFTRLALFQSPGNLMVDDIACLFFTNEPCRFNRFENRQYPRVMRDWLHRLYLGEREHRLHLVISEVMEGVEDALSVDIQVEQRGQLKPLSELLGDDRLSDVRMSALTDLALLADYLPDIERLYQASGDRSLVYSLAEFTPVLLQTLPALKMLGIQLVLPKGLRNLAYPKLGLSLSSDSDETSDKPVSYLNLDQLLNFNWQIAVG